MENPLLDAATTEKESLKKRLALHTWPHSPSNFPCWLPSPTNRPNLRAPLSSDSRAFAGPVLYVYLSKSTTLSFPPKLNKVFAAFKYTLIALQVEPVPTRPR